MSDSYFQISQDDSVQIMELALPPEVDPLVLDRVIQETTQAVVNRPGAPWVLDMGKVRYLNSAGLGLLCNIREKIRKSGGHLVLCNMAPMLAQLFRSCCLEKLFTISKTRPDAITTVRKQAKVK
jgi:anti-sigma B factor antagonist/stage II sporulation protein AA (anti-sigma F factor antagonist)